MKTLKKIIALTLCFALIGSCGAVTLVSGYDEAQKHSENKVKTFFENVFFKIKEFFLKIASFFVGNKFKGSDYTIPELDLSVMPEDIENTEYEYLYNLHKFFAN